MISASSNSCFSDETITKRRITAACGKNWSRSVTVNRGGKDWFCLKGSPADLMEEALPKDCAEMQ